MFFHVLQDMKSLLGVLLFLTVVFWDELMFIFIIEMRYTIHGSNRAEEMPFCCLVIILLFVIFSSYFFLLGRLLSRSNTEKPDAIDENGKEENIMKNMFSKKRKIEVADCEIEVIPIELEARPGSMETQEYPPKLHSNTKEPVM